jgi:hypothetical protein
LNKDDGFCAIWPESNPLSCDFSACLYLSFPFNKTILSACHVYLCPVLCSETQGPESQANTNAHKKRHICLSSWYNMVIFQQKYCKSCQKARENSIWRDKVIIKYDKHTYGYIISKLQKIKGKEEMLKEARGVKILTSWGTKLSLQCTIRNHAGCVNTKQGRGHLQTRKSTHQNPTMSAPWSQNWASRAVRK